jgi:hypothetical protein
MGMSFASSDPTLASFSLDYLKSPDDADDDTFRMWGIEAADF